MTIKQFLALQARSSLPPWSARNLFRTFPTRALGFRNTITAIDNQTVGYFVQLRSASLLTTATSFDDFQMRLSSGEGTPTESELAYVSQQVLAPRGITLALVSGDLRSGALIGVRSAMRGVPTTPLTPQTVEDGMLPAVVGGALLGTGGIIIIATATLATAVTGPMIIGIFVGAALLGAGGILFGAGLDQLLTPPSTPQTGSPGNSSDNTSVQQPDGDSIDVPNGEAYGEPPITGWDPDSAAQYFATNAGNFVPGWNGDAWIDFDVSIGASPDNSSNDSSDDGAG